MLKIHCGMKLHINMMQSKLNEFACIYKTGADEIFYNHCWFPSNLMHMFFIGWK